MINSYIETALWSTLADEDSDIENLDDKYCIDDLSEETLAKAGQDLDNFVKQAGDLLKGLDLNQVAHDFWLTRNGHGAGFWDGDYEKELGEKLTTLSESFGEINLYVGDDDKIYD